MPTWRSLMTGQKIGQGIGQNRAAMARRRHERSARAATVPAPKGHHLRVVIDLVPMARDVRAIAARAQMAGAPMALHAMETTVRITKVVTVTADHTQARECPA
jgi:hypothetical protein